MVHHCLHPPCKKAYVNRRDMLKHYKTHSQPAAPPKQFNYNECGKGFTTKQWLIEHQEGEHANSFRCEECTYIFRNYEFLETRICVKHKKFM